MCDSFMKTTGDSLSRSKAKQDVIAQEQCVSDLLGGGGGGSFSDQ